MSRAEIQAGRAFVSLYVKTSEFAHGLVSAELRLKSFAGAVNTVGEILAAISPANIIHKLTDAISSMGYKLSHALKSVGDGLLSLGKTGALLGAGLGAVLIGITAKFAHFGDQLWVTSQRTGATTQLISEMGYALRQTGGDASDFETSFRAMQRTIGDAASGSDEAAAALTRAEVSIDQLLAMTPDQQFEAIADGIAGIKDPTLAASAALDVLGRSGAVLVPAMQNMREFRKEAQILGISVTPAQAKVAEQLVDKFQALKEAAFGGIVSAMEALAPAILDAIKAATDLAVKFHAWVANNHETVRLVGKIAIGMIEVSAAVLAVGVALKGAAVIVGMMTGSFSMIGHIVAKILPLFVFLGGPIVALATSLFMSVVGAGLLAAAFVAIGTVALYVLPEILIILGLIAAGVTTISALIAGAATAAAATAYAFWKLTDPFTALKPVAMAAFDAIKNIGLAFSEGGLEGAANAAIEGMKQVFLRGTMALLEMARNAITRLPGLISSTLSGIGSATSGITGTITRLFTEMWPAIKASFMAFYSFAADVFDQLPQLAGYAAGRMIRAILSGMVKLNNFVWSSWFKLQSGLLNIAASFAQDFVKALLTGDISSVVTKLGERLTREMRVMAVGAAGFGSGLFGGDVPEFKLSGNTLSAMERVSSQFSRAQSGMASQPFAASDISRSPAMRGAMQPGFSASIAAFEIEKPDIDPTDLQKYRDELYKLRDALAAEQITSDEFVQGVRQLKRETLGIDSTPLEQFYERLEILNAAQKDNVITSAEWTDQFAKLKRDILGLKTDPIEEYHKKLELLYALLGKGDITQAEFNAAALEALPDKAKQIFDETRTPLEKYKADLAELEKLQGVLDPDTFHRKKEMLRRGYEEETKRKDEDVKATGPTSFVSYSATAAMNFGTSGSPQDRLLKEAQEQKKIAKDQLEETRRNTAAVEKLANGLKQRR